MEGVVVKGEDNKLKFFVDRNLLSIFVNLYDRILILPPLYEM